MPPRPIALAAAALVAAVLGGCGGGGQSHTTAGTVPTPKPKPQPPRHTPTHPAPAKPRPKPSKPATAPAAPPTGELIAHGPRTGHDIALTFDADMTRGMQVLARQGSRRYFDPAIISALHGAHADATIFMTGLWAQTYPDIARQLARDPSIEIENHSVDHAAWSGNCYGLPHISGDAAKRAEVSDAAREIEQATGVTPRYFRFPGGCHSATDPAVVASLGEQAVQWDVVSGDPFQPDPGPIERAVLGGVRPGSIVVMHVMGPPNAPATASALKTILPALAARGYHFVKLRRLLGG